MDKLETTIENAPQFWQWLQKRGGLLVWRSVNLSNPSASWTTPAWQAEDNPELCPRPTWQAATKPERHVTDPADVVVLIPREVKRFHVAVQRGDSFNFTLTDASSRRLRKAVQAAGKGAWHEFDFYNQEAVILVADQEIPIAEWARLNT